MNREPEIIANDADETFRRVQRDQCGAVYAGAETLATLVEALKRESIAYAFSPIWIEPDAITSAQNAYAERKEAAAQVEADDRRKLADAAALEAQRAKDLSESESGRQAELRKEFGAKAKDAAERVAKLARAWIDGENAPVGRLYPQFARWLQTRRDDHWQIESVNSTIADYGVARWKDRPVEAAATTLTLRMKNRLLGEYADACFTLGIVLDDEFQELRAPLEAPCAQTSVFAAWRRDNRFESRWLIGAR